MSIAYFRNSTRNFKETIDSLKAAAQKAGWEVTGEVELNKKSTAVMAINKKVAAHLAEGHHEVLSILPQAVYVLEKDGKVLIGGTEPTLLKNISNDPHIMEAGEQIEKELQQIIHEAGAVKPLEVKNVILYSTMSCPYCRMEKQWLDENKVKYELIYVDQDQQAAENLVRRTGQMGVPVTEVAYNEGEPEFIVGFDKAKLSGILKV